MLVIFFSHVIYIDNCSKKGILLLIDSMGGVMGILNMFRGPSEQISSGSATEAEVHAAYDQVA